MIPISKTRQVLYLMKKGRYVFAQRALHTLILCGKFVSFFRAASLKYVDVDTVELHEISTK